MSNPMAERIICNEVLLFHKTSIRYEYIYIYIYIYMLGKKAKYENELKIDTVTLCMNVCAVLPFCSYVLAT
jgi:hypothetical protein